MTRDHLLVIDQGTTSTRAVVYDDRLKPVGQGQRRSCRPTLARAGSSTIPPPSWPRWALRLLGPRSMSGVKADRIAAIGLTNQRETTIVWERGDRQTDRAGPGLAGPPDGRYLRSAQVAGKIGVCRATGLVIDPYFSATKIAWILDHVPGARRRAEAGELAAGTVD